MLALLLMLLLFGWWHLGDDVVVPLPGGCIEGFPRAGHQHRGETVRQTTLSCCWFMAMHCVSLEVKTSNHLFVHRFCIAARFAYRQDQGQIIGLQLLFTLGLYNRHILFTYTPRFTCVWKFVNCRDWGKEVLEGLQGKIVVLDDAEEDPSSRKLKWVIFVLKGI